MDETRKSGRKPEDVLKEFPTIGKYRLRMVKKGDKPPQLDIREYVKAETFEGFTRRGVRFAGRAEMEQLLGVLHDAMQMA